MDENRSRRNREGASTQKPCYQFLSGSCRFGKSCKFSHENKPFRASEPSSRPATRETGGPTNKTKNKPEEQAAFDNYRSWKQTLRQLRGKGNLVLCNDLWKKSLQIMNHTKEIDNKQRIVKDLASNELEGLTYISYTITTDFGIDLQAKFEHLVLPFLLFIAHNFLLESLTIDTSVGDLYQFLAGSNCERGSYFFERVMDELSSALERGQWSFTCFADLEVSFANVIEVTARAILEMVRRNQRAVFNTDFLAIEKRLRTLNNDNADRAGQISAYHTTIFHLNQIHAIVSRGVAMLKDASGHGSPSSLTKTLINLKKLAINSTFPVQIDLPRNRHDNDSLDIRKISILPTLQEIKSQEQEYLPFKEANQPHFLHGADRLIDTHFRLLRHDVIGEMKNAVGNLLPLLHEHGKNLSSSKALNMNYICHLYDDASIHRFHHDQKRGLEVCINFLQPPAIRKANRAKQEEWWNGKKKRLDIGSLACLVGYDEAANEESANFLIITERETTSPDKHSSLVTGTSFGRIKVKLAREGSNADIEALIRAFFRPNINRLVLLEFPRLIPATFVPVLRNLQNMQETGQLPFHNIIADDTAILPKSSPKSSRILPPLYARDPGYAFTLKSITDGNGLYTLSAQVVLKDLVTVRSLRNLTSLDEGQCEALISGLTQEVALIQGPPGTGKSYLGVKLMQVLAENQERSLLGPIIVVCYTNHALDQFLESLLSVGIKKIIRVGGQSKSAALDGLNLRIVAKTEQKTRTEGSTLYHLHRAQEDLDLLMEDLLNTLHGLKQGKWSGLRGFLERRYFEIYQQFLARLRPDLEGYQKVHAKKPSQFDPLRDWCTASGSNYALEQATQRAKLTVTMLTMSAGVNIDSISFKDRKRMVHFWVDEAAREVREQLDDITADFAKNIASMQQVYNEIDRRCLQRAEVIGLTTTGLAKCIETLRHLKCKVLLCEEAGEVLEAHLLSALLPSVQHLIQIGDHQQLRPQINNYNLSLESPKGELYKLDESMFERLVIPNDWSPTLPVAQLNVQRRMRPNISRLIRATIYPRLQDDISVCDYPKVFGIKKNVFWVDHRHLEAGLDMDDPTQRSHHNDWEIKFTHALVRHIIRQGVYSSEEIAVLTPYAGQLQRLRSELKESFEVVLSERDVDFLAREGYQLEDEHSPKQNKPTAQRKTLCDLLRIATVDNFQGEEAEIVIVSLVRSNKEKKVGFLRTTNRINVLLSRAKHGLYILGNGDTASSIKMWQDVLGMLRMEGAVGEALPLICERHPNTIIEVQNPEDFARMSPEGGCTLQCDRRLEACGHQCLSKCHSQKMHQVYACPQLCARIHPTCSHPCPKICSDPCGHCMVNVKGFSLPCRHLANTIPCFQTQTPASIFCRIVVSKTVPTCKHIINVACSLNVEDPNYKCQVECTNTHLCGHLCSGTCSSCIFEEGIVKHQACAKVCGRKFAGCNHRCRRKCHDGENCGLCTAECEVQCGHSACDLFCSIACAPCIQRCTWSCEHMGACNMPCAAPCDRLPCNQRCGKFLTCGHQCPSVCGEICPAKKFCQQCCDNDKSNHRVDMLEFRNYSEIDLEETPIIILGCGHFFTIETLDGLFELPCAYIVDESGEYNGLNDGFDGLADSLPSCPDCRQPVRQYSVNRYNRIINRSIIHEMTKKFVIEKQNILATLETSLAKIEKDLKNSRSDFVTSIRFVNEDELSKAFLRSPSLTALMKECTSLVKTIAEAEQPAYKLRDATVLAIRKLKAQAMESELDMNPMSFAPPDRGMAVKARFVLMTSQYIQFSDALQCTHELLSRATGGLSESLVNRIDSQWGAFNKNYQNIETTAREQSLHSLSVQAIICNARLVGLYRSFIGSYAIHKVEKAQLLVNSARITLDEAIEICQNNQFKHTKELKLSAEATLEALKFDKISRDEISSIVLALKAELGSTTGHWYNCRNGHPFAVGECGRPMQEARCPECGSPVGGSHHTPAAGVTRATQIE